MKKIISAFAIAAILLTCTACSNSETSNTNPTQSSIEDQDVTDNSSANSIQSSIEEQSKADNSGSKGQNSASESNGSSSSSDKPTAPTVPTDLKPSEGFEFESNGDGTCTLVKIGICTDKDIVIPEKSPEGDTITLIDEYALSSLDVDSVTLLNYNYEIDDCAFQHGKFTTLNIFGGTPVFNESAFYSCEKLKTITFNSCTIELGEYSFASCGKDATLNFYNCTGTIDECAFQHGDYENIIISGCEFEIKSSAFYSCEALLLLNITSSTIEAGEYSFASSGDEAGIEFSDSKITLDDCSFQHSSLKSVVINNCDLEIGDSAFYSCDDLAEVKIDCGKVKMGEYSFASCEDLTMVSICDNGKKDNSIEVGDNTFQNCERLTTVVIGNGNIKIGDYIFYNCSDDMTITVAGKNYTPDSIKNGI